MTELLTAAQMRAIEVAAIESGAVSGLDLMERAGKGVVAAIFAQWPDLRAAPQRAVVLCGPGNNGGDGFVVARLLQGWGWQVDAYLYGDPAKLPPDAMANYTRWQAMGQVHSFNAFDWPELADRPLVIDAVFGTGLTRPVASAVWGVFAMVREAGCKLVAVDLPSGICADSGRLLCQDALAEWSADLTVTFERPRQGHFLAQAPAFCGVLAVAPIGCAAAVASYLYVPEAAAVTELGSCASDLEKHGGHKFDHGHALILSGGVASGGAARLAARGALRIGAGVVSLGCPSSAVLVNAAQLNAVMVKPVAAAADLAQLLQDRRINALCLGPGMGVARAAAMLPLVLDHCQNTPLALVLDADALTALAQDPALLTQLPANCVLTPHGGEFARLFPDIAEDLANPARQGPAYSKVDACRAAAARAGCVVLFKGAETVIANPLGHCVINSAHYERAAPWLATAGSGDVLAGFVTGLLARGFAAMRAAETAAWLHVECARSFGPGLIAEDLPEELPKVLRGLAQAGRDS